MRSRRAEPRIVDPATHPRRYVSLRVAAAYLEVDPKTLNKYLDDDLLEYLQFGRRRKIEVRELLAFERRQLRSAHERIDALVAENARLSEQLERSMQRYLALKLEISTALMGLSPALEDRPVGEAIAWLRQQLADQQQVAARLRELLKQLRCEHLNRTGGNDYIVCDACGLYFDYRKLTLEAALKQHVSDGIAALVAEQPEEENQSRVDGFPEGAHGDLPRPATE